MGADIERYVLYGTDDPEKAKKAHELMKYIRNNFIENKHIQNLLLNDGYILEDDKRPKSFHDVHDMTWHRSTVSMTLSYLETVIDIATRPQNIYISSVDSVIIKPKEQPELKIKTAGGHDFSKVERLQIDWLEKHTIREKIRKYEKALKSAFDEYNLKYVLGLAVHIDLQIYNTGAEERRLRRKIIDAVDGKTYHCLDNAYYTRGNSLKKVASRLGEELYKDPYGKFFVLTPQKAHKMVGNLRSREL
jgi:hypothetical protein